MSAVIPLFHTVPDRMTVGAFCRAESAENAENPVTLITHQRESLQCSLWSRYRQLVGTNRPIKLADRQTDSFDLGHDPTLLNAAIRARKHTVTPHHTTPHHTTPHHTKPHRTAPHHANPHHHRRNQPRPQPASPTQAT